MILESWSNFMTLTPKVERPVCEILDTPVRMTTPVSVITMISSSPLTVARPANRPFFSVILTVLIPLPPRPLVGYSDAAVRLP